MKKEINLSKNKLKTIHDHISRIEDDIESFGLQRESTLFTSTQVAISIGKRFRRLKKLNKKLRRNWQSYLKEKYPYMEMRTIQRYMLVSQKINTRKFPAIALVKVSKIYNFISLCKQRDQVVEKILNELAATLNLKKLPTSVEDTFRFRVVFDSMIEDLKEDRNINSDSRVVDSGKNEKQTKLDKDVRHGKKTKPRRGKKQKPAPSKNLKKSFQKKHRPKQLITSVNRAADTLVNNLDILMNEREKINLEAEEDFGDLDRHKIKTLFNLLKENTNLWR